MNLTQETNDYFSTTDLPKEGKKYYIAGIDPASNISNSFKYTSIVSRPTISNQIFKGDILKLKEAVDDDYCNANSALKDKLKTTPSAELTWLSKSFRVDWKKVLKKLGW